MCFRYQLYVCIYSNPLFKISFDTGETWTHLRAGTVFISKASIRLKNFAKKLSAHLISLPFKNIPKTEVDSKKLVTTLYYPSRIGSKNPQHYCFVSVFIYVYFINNPILNRVGFIAYRYMYMIIGVYTLCWTLI